MMKNILFISHKSQQCGVYQFGFNIAKAIQKSKKYSFIYKECSSSEELMASARSLKPSVIIYNYHSLTLPWLQKQIMNKIKVPHIGIIHEVTQQVADRAENDFFDYHIAPDPTLLLNNPIVFKTGRLIPLYINTHTIPETPIIGSFGFGLKGKGFEKIITVVQEEYDSALIRLHIPFANFGDADGNQALAIAEHCKKLILKPGIQLSLSHEFLSQEQLLDFLAQNTVNAFFYEKYDDRGISSVIDYALAVQRPIVITKSNMFRHVIGAKPSICIEDLSCKQIINNGIQPLSHFCQEWSEANFIWDYERIIDKVLREPLKKKNNAKIFLFLTRVRNKVYKILGRQPIKVVTNKWVQQIENKHVESLPSSEKNTYDPVIIPDGISLNRILDDAARAQYKPAIEKLFTLLPELMARKIPEANVQQAFVFDTVHKFAAKFAAPKILCVGSYEDTAAAGLKQIGYQMAEIDPVLNYDLEEYFNRPSTMKGSYDIIFSTSVLEHVQDDELFMTQIVELLAPGGIAVLTCDYNDQYKPGDPIPDVDFRFYTQKDFRQRILPLLKGCSLVDEPQWDCPNPDFIYAGYYRYTFATLVFQKEKE